jgi:hypothetical protein
MTVRRTHVFLALLLVSSFCRAYGANGDAISTSEYRLELDRLLSATQQLNSSRQSLPPGLQSVPSSWRVHTDQQDFEIPTEDLRKDISNLEHENNADHAIAIRSRLQALRDDLDGFETAPVNVATQREHLKALLARPEFRDVHSPNFLERFQQAVLAALIHALGRMFGSSAFPTISRIFIYGLIAVAVCTLGFLAYRFMNTAGSPEGVLPTANLPVSAKAWSVWLAEARAAAARENWRDAVHLAYWGGISYLENEGAWRPDRARTPREYLRLLSKSPERRENLASLTRVFELAWYAKRETGPEAFAESMEALQRLGCYAA